MMWKRILQSKIFTAVIFVMLVFSGYKAIERLPLLESVNREKDILEEKIADANIAETKFQGMSIYASSDAYLERQARLKLNYKKPGEEVVYIYHNNSQKEQIQALANPGSNLRQWWDYVTRD